MKKANFLFTFWVFAVANSPEVYYRVINIVALNGIFVHVLPKDGTSLRVHHFKAGGSDDLLQSAAVGTGWGYQPPPRIMRLLCEQHLPQNGGHLFEGLNQD